MYIVSFYFIELQCALLISACMFKKCVCQSGPPWKTTVW